MWSTALSLDVARITKVLRKSCSLRAEEINRIVWTIFPTDPVLMGDDSVDDAEGYPLFIMNDLEDAFTSIRNSQALEPDGIPTKLYKPSTGARSFQRILPEGSRACAGKQRERKS